MSALLLFVYNCQEDDKAGQASQDLLVDIKSQISSIITADGSDDAGVSTTEPGDVSSSVVVDMPYVKVQGYEFIGYLTIPKLDLELPVLGDWDYAKLNVAPCRQAGSIATDDLVIAAHNYIAHFAKLEYIGVNDDVIFTNMNGNSIDYKVTEVRVVDGENVEEVVNSGHDLVLYTCTYEGTTRVVAFCDRKI